MPLTWMSLEDYRCFNTRADIELRPITVVLGRNNSGKSALVRAPVILGTGIHTETPAPLDLDSLGEELVDTFTDLVYGDPPFPRITVALGVEERLGPLRIDGTIQHVADHRTQVVSALTLTQAGLAVASLEWEPSSPPEQPRYEVRVGDDAWRDAPVRFAGLLPRSVEGVPTEVQRTILTYSGDFRSGFPAVRYLGPFRKRPDRRVRLPGRRRVEVGVSGEHALGMLASDAARDQGRLADEINNAFEAHLRGWRLQAVERGGMWSVMLASRTDPAASVNIADTGTGVAQLLPILVQRAADLSDPSHAPTLEVVEQPELHLHPSAHAPLADLYLDAIALTSTRFLIETHSETLLLRLRRRVAEGHDPADIAIYFVDQTEGAGTVRRIVIDPDGNVDFWPSGVFTEDYEETQALARAQWQRRDADAR